MKLSEMLEDQFDAFTRSKGKEYYHRRLVEFQEMDGRVALFEVSGAQVYHVGLEYLKDSESFNSQCTCPHFADGFECKHLWASILEADHLQLVPQIMGENSRVEKLPRQAEAATQLPHWRDMIEQAQRKIEKNRQIHNFRKPGLAKNVNPRIGMYAVDITESRNQDQILLQLFMQERLKKGDFGKQKNAELTHEKIQFYEDPAERDFLWDLIGRTEVLSSYTRYTLTHKIDNIAMTPEHAAAILRKISDSGKLFRLNDRVPKYYGGFDKQELLPYTYDFKKWNFRLRLKKSESTQGFLLSGEMYADQDQVRPINEIVAIVGSFIFFSESMASADLTDSLPWYELVKQKALKLSDEEMDAFLDYFFSQAGGRVQLELPEEIHLLQRNDIEPTVQVSLTRDKSSSQFSALMAFDYQGKISPGKSGSFIYDFAAKEKIVRKLEFETASLEKFFGLGAGPSEDPRFEGHFLADQFVPAVEKMLELGWRVLAQDQRLRQASDFKINFTSGVDWFDVNGEVKFGDRVLRLPQLLHALKVGERMVGLDDGTMGLLPEAWLKRFSQVASLGKISGESVRLSKVQALFVNAGLDENEKFQGDNKFQSLNKIFLDLQNLTPQEPGKKFKGTLRDYQKIGLSWLTKISENELGGILADDMGLGKTIQILSLLADQPVQNTLPSLVVAPKSLIFNWQKEAAVFTPHLKVMAYTGSHRQALAKQFASQDLILTTYHTLRKDIEEFQKQQFNFLILDEAHNLKNPQSQMTMAAKLISASKKIALTGTPVENSLMDLFSILSVVLPGLVTTAQAQRWTKENDPKNIRRLARAVRPFLLRRTKDQVLKDLPEKSEQVLYCELSENEQKKYNELKTFYWAQLSGTIEEKGLAKSKIEVLEALLRLRQAACHQGLLDKKFSHLPSAKFELVLEQLQTVIRDGHKALVFSQFTSLLELFAQRLDGINYEYLDGKTENRAERVAHFQTNENCQVFLLSLKAGGVGLNLTAADYVFILDPWWNPAAESQAIDRAHRIGQTKKVFAYKIIAKDTVEEKILALQEKKKNLAKAIISDEAGLLKSLKFEELRDLFL